MSLNFENQVDSIGGGGLGGLGNWGGGGGFLTLLILFGLFGDGFGRGRNGEAGAGVLAGQTQAKLDCLERGQSEISQQIAFNRSNDQFQALGAQVSDLAGIQRDATAAITAQNNDLSRQLASCCCDIKVGQQGIQTSIAAQSAALLAAGKDNTQKILDKLCDTQVQALQTENNRLVNAANTNSIIAAILSQCGPAACGSSTAAQVAQAIQPQAVPQAVPVA